MKLQRKEGMTPNIRREKWRLGSFNGGKERLQKEKGKSLEKTERNSMVNSSYYAT